jgi:hypothetical protein
MRKRSSNFSKSKGSRFEREVAEFFKTTFECEAYRSQQYCGANGDGDVTTNLPIHVECKRVEALSLYSALAQSKEDAKPGTIPLVIHKKNNKPSVLIVELDNLTKLITALYDKIKTTSYD